MLLRMCCRPGWPLRPEGAAVSCARAEVCVLALELSVGWRQGQPRAEGLVKVKVTSQWWSSASLSNLSAQQPIRKAKITQVDKTFLCIMLGGVHFLSENNYNTRRRWHLLFLILFLQPKIWHTWELPCLLLCSNEQWWDWHRLQVTWDEGSSLKCVLWD